MRRTAWLENLRDDLRFAARQLVRSPGFTIVAIVTLALGIGANTAIFSIVYSTLLKPLPYAGGDRLLSLRERNGPNDTHGMVVTAGNYGDWLRRSHNFKALGASGLGTFTLTGAGDPQQLAALHVTAGYWKALYIPPALGRYFSDAEDRPDAPHVVVLSSALWKLAFNADRSIVGRSISLNGNPYIVIGVAPDEYALTTKANSIWVPYALTPQALAEHADHELSVVGLVRRGVSSEAAVAELTRIEGDLARQYPHSNFDGGIIATPMRDAVVGPVKQQLLILFAAVALVLLIACANVTNLLLARAAVRQTELAIRGALGAARSRIVAQLLAESLLLACAGAVLGLGLAAAGVRFFVTRAPASIPRLHDATLNGYALAFAAGLTLACTFLLGLLPALRGTRTDLQRVLREGGRTGGGAISERLRAVLVVAEVAVAIVLLIGAGLLIRTAILMEQVSPGFNPANVTVANVSLPRARYDTPERVTAAYDEILNAVSAAPGVKLAGMVSRIPIGRGGYDCGVTREGVAKGESGGADANFRPVTPSYFATMAIPVLRGRTFATADNASAPPVIMINRGLAHALFGDADAVGKRVTHCDATLRTVIGVTGDIHSDGLNQPTTNEVYYPEAQIAEPAMSIAVRGSIPTASAVADIRHAVSAVDPLLAISNVTTMDDIVAGSMAATRFNMMLLSLLGVTGLVLAAVGIYGVISYFVTQRTREIGIRMALGADAQRVVAMVVRQATSIAAIGVCVGLAASLMASRVLSSSLYGVSVRDPLTFAAVALVFIVVAIVASFIPAKRAAGVDPLSAVRSA
jgi:putative ABC transport system permease protein